MDGYIVYKKGKAFHFARFLGTRNLTKLFSNGFVPLNNL
jgi:hypothetical protein